MLTILGLPELPPFDTKPTKYLADSAMSVSSDINSALEGTPFLRGTVSSLLLKYWAVNEDSIIREDSVFLSNINTRCPIRAQKQPPREASAIGPVVDATIPVMTNASVTIVNTTLLPRDTSGPRERPVSVHVTLSHG